MKQKGFTLVELLVVMVIVVVLIGISVNSIISQQKKSRDARRKADLENVRAAMERYRTETTLGQYPPTPAGGSKNLSGYGPVITPYLHKLPRDPKSGNDYQIDVKTGGYNLQTTLEFPAGITPAPPCPAPTGLMNCTGAPSSCNYCVTQP